MDKYNQGKNYVSDNLKEVVISGGNHAQLVIMENKEKIMMPKY